MNLRSLIPFGRDRGVARWAATDPFTAMQREIDRLFEDFTRDWSTYRVSDWPAYRTSDMTPRTDIAESDKEFEITAELPGLEEKDVEVHVADNILTIKGEKKAEKEEKDKNYRAIERSYGSFSRSLELPDGIDPGTITATIANGVLKVTVPKPAPVEAKKVPVKSAA